MAITNSERIGKSLELLRDGLKPFIDREMKAIYGPGWAAKVQEILNDTRLLSANVDDPAQDVAVMLVLMDRLWGEVFKRILGKAERSMVNELLDVRNRWAHQRTFSSDDTYRALDSIGRLLASVSAPQADEVDKAKMELLRVRFDEQLRTERRKSAGTAIESQVTGTLKPWREVVTPHADVATGRYQQAEFAADLWQVHLGQGGAEYRDPVEFFRRTFLTESLKRLLVGAVQRLTENTGDPVVQLQTNFGGGKTHSMLALYHLFSGIPAADLPNVDTLLKDAGVTTLPKARRVVLVGNKISPGNPVTKPDGTVVRTLWGELAYQLGGRAAFERIRADDERATSPGDKLRELFNDYGPCVILIDEWVAYARQLHDQGDLPAGGFETQFTFAQVLTESAKLARNCLLVISLPASDTGTSPHAQANDVEVGGQRGREALSRLQNVIGRVESSWRPASAEEGFEIVRRRLFEPLADREQFVARDGVARAFCDFYKANRQEFPPECHEGEYEKRLKAAYPIHPEVFDRLYNDWSTLVKFQRTRGVLRLMASVIHSLWEKGDRNPLIMPASIPIDDPRVQFELTRYLSDQWTPIIEKDVDGVNSLPMRIDGEVPNLGKYHACRRVARTIYLGSAPIQKAANQGIEDRRIKLGCAMPGESPTIFGDALRRLSTNATYLYVDGARYWYSTQPTVTKLADDRAEQLKRKPEDVARELEKRIRKDVQKTGDFSRVHALPQSGQDVSDDMDARLVVLGLDHPYSKEAGNPADAAAKAILESRGTAPRIYRNTLVFLAMDKNRLQDLDEAVRKFLAWESILSERETLDLTPQQVKQATTQLAAADSTVAARLPEAYIWLIVPDQETPQSQVEWKALKLTGSDALAIRASRKLRNDDLLVLGYGLSLLKRELDNIPLWRGDHVSIRQLVEDYARYLYLPRLKDPSYLLGAISEGLRKLSWESESFAYADGYDEANHKYLGLVAAEGISITDPCSGTLLVKPSVARRQFDADQKVESALIAGAEKKAVAAGAGGGSVPLLATGPQVTPKPRRFHGSVRIDEARVASHAGKIAEEVIVHLNALMGARVTVTLEIEAEVPDGVQDNVVRTVTENCRTLKFTSQGFEVD